MSREPQLMAMFVLRYNIKTDSHKNWVNFEIWPTFWLDVVIDDAMSV